MWHNAKLYAATALVIMTLDALWLGLLMTGFYKNQLGTLARRSGDALNPIWWAALVVYVILPLGILAFVLPRTGGDSPLLSALAWGALFGVTTYGVYDFTNYSTLDKWPLVLVAVDVIWGGVICGTAAVAARSLDGWLS